MKEDSHSLSSTFMSHECFEQGLLRSIRVLSWRAVESSDHNHPQRHLTHLKDLKETPTSTPLSGASKPWWHCTYENNGKVALKGLCFRWFMGRKPAVVACFAVVARLHDNIIACTAPQGTHISTNICASGFAGRFRWCSSSLHELAK